jgi:hypothetical protein
MLKDALCMCLNEELAAQIYFSWFPISLKTSGSHGSKYEV